MALMLALDRRLKTYIRTVDSEQVLYGLQTDGVK